MFIYYLLFLLSLSGYRSNLESPPLIGDAESVLLLLVIVNSIRSNSQVRDHSTNNRQQVRVSQAVRQSGVQAPQVPSSPPVTDHYRKSAIYTASVRIKFLIVAVFFFNFFKGSQVPKFTDRKVRKNLKIPCQEYRLKSEKVTSTGKNSTPLKKFFYQPVYSI